jgi:hypothetical protein
MVRWLTVVLRLEEAGLKSRRNSLLENLALRHQLLVLSRGPVTITTSLSWTATVRSRPGRYRVGAVKAEIPAALGNVPAVTALPFQVVCQPVTSLMPTLWISPCEVIAQRIYRRRVHLAETHKHLLVPRAVPTHQFRAVEQRAMGIGNRFGSQLINFKKAVG